DCVVITIRNVQVTSRIDPNIGGLVKMRPSAYSVAATKNAALACKRSYIPIWHQLANHMVTRIGHPDSAVPIDRQPVGRAKKRGTRLTILITTNVRLTSYRCDRTHRSDFSDHARA